MLIMRSGEVTYERKPKAYPVNVYILAKSYVGNNNPTKMERHNLLTIDDYASFKRLMKNIYKVVETKIGNVDSFVVYGEEIC